MSKIKLRSPLIKARLTFPMARSPLSKSSMTPRKRKATPNPARPTPISAKVENLVESQGIMSVFRAS